MWQPRSRCLALGGVLGLAAAAPSLIGSTRLVGCGSSSSSSSSFGPARGVRLQRVHGVHAVVSELCRRRRDELRRRRLRGQPQRVREQRRQAHRLHRWPLTQVATAVVAADIRRCLRLGAYELAPRECEERGVERRGNAVVQNEAVDAEAREEATLLP